MTTSNNENEFTSHDVELENAPTEYEYETTEPTVNISKVLTEEEIQKELTEDIQWSVKWKIESYHKKVAFIPMNQRMHEFIAEWIEVERLKMKHISTVNVSYSYEMYPMVTIYFNHDGRMEHLDYLIATLSGVSDINMVTGEREEMFGLLDKVEDHNTTRSFTFMKDGAKSLTIDVHVGGSKHCKVISTPTGETKPVLTTRIECEDQFAAAMKQMEEESEK